MSRAFFLLTVVFSSLMMIAFSSRKQKPRESACRVLKIIYSFFFFVCVCVFADVLLCFVRRFFSDFLHRKTDERVKRVFEK